jgi:hypothetical protein
MTDRDTINQLGRDLIALLGPGERSVTIHPPGGDTPNGSISITSTNGIVAHCSEAVGLYDAIHMARRHVEIESVRLMKGEDK